MARPSDEQLLVIEEATGHFLVRACPGSGKTYTIALKAALDIKNWKRKRQGLAVLSFTNIAQEKIVDDIEQVSGIGIEYPHFIGTIDSFINQYIFFPYIYLLGFDPNDVEMIGEPFQSSEGWFLKRKCALALRYDLSGELILPAGSTYELSKVKDKGIVQKLGDIEKSRFTQSDAVFYALQILELYPEVVDIVSARFPWIYVDEAQDTTAIHWKILELIADSTENERFGVIGDPDQSIYAWNGAKPELFIEHQARLENSGAQVFYLLESWRSSQTLCDFYSPYSSLPSVPKAVEKSVASIGVKPILKSYTNYKEILDAVNNYSNSMNDDETYAIVCQSHSFILEILGSALDASILISKNPISKDNKNAHDLMHAKYDYDRGNYKSALLRAENVACNLLWNFKQDEVLKAKGLTVREWYTLIEDDLEKLPRCDISLDDWCLKATIALTESCLFKPIVFEPKRKALGIDYKTCIVDHFFTDADAQEAEQLISTIHAVKGATRDHVFVILGIDQSGRLLKGLRGKTINDTEDRRKLYVAITRARKTITICVPKSCYDEIVKEL